MDPITRARGRPFQPGRSGNPGGRPKVIREVQDLARQHGAEAIETLAAIMTTSKSDSARIAAACAILDRGYGKPRQTVHTNVARPLAQLTDEELMVIAMGGSVEDEDDASTTPH